MTAKIGHRIGASTDIPEHHGIRWMPLSLFVIGAIVIWGLFWVALTLLVPGWRDHAQFDMFSAAGALFSAFAFAGLIYTIMLQRMDLQLQLKELQQTRDELRGQKEQLEAQNTTLRRQSFETRFFEWIKLHHEIVRAIEFQFPFAGMKTGRDCFRLFVDALKAAYAEVLRGASPVHLRERGNEEPVLAYFERLVQQAAMSPTDAAQLAYADTFSQIQGRVGHYFRNLYNLVKFVDNSDLSKREKRFYTNIIRAQLSSDELVLLFYNCLGPQGADKFKPLIERYGLLKNMDRSLLLSPAHVQNYVITAFQGAPDRFSDESLA